MFRLACLAQQPQEPAIFHAGTRLVEVEVVARDKRIRPPGLGNWLSWTFDIGPPFGPPGEPHEGLIKEDFSLLDRGKPQEIPVFRAGAASSSAESSTPVPPGFVTTRRGGIENPKGTAAILIDFLNTRRLDSHSGSGSRRGIARVAGIMEVSDPHCTAAFGIRLA